MSMWREDDLQQQLERTERALAIARSALESVAWGYTGGHSAKTLGEIAGKALTKIENELAL